MCSFIRREMTVYFCESASSFKLEWQSNFYKVRRVNHRCGKYASEEFFAKSTFVQRVTKL